VDPGAACPARAAASATLKNSPTTAINYNMVTSSGMSRRYILRYPSNYDNTHPYRLVLAYHWNTGSAAQVFDCNQESIKCYTTQSPFYGLWNLSNNSTIFVAPDGLNAGWANTTGRTSPSPTTSSSRSRTISASTSRGSSPTGSAMARACRSRSPVLVRMFSGPSGFTRRAAQRLQRRQLAVAYYATHGLDDGTLQISGGRTMRDRFVKNNGCTAMNPPEPANNSGSHICTSYQVARRGTPSVGARSMAATVTTRRPRTQASP
jgi:hypothetical protein